MNKPDNQQLNEEVKKKIAAGLLITSTFHPQIHAATHLLIQLFHDEFDILLRDEQPLIGLVGSIFQMGYEASEEQQKEFTKAEFKDHDEEADTADNMVKFGGSFVIQLGAAYRTADQFNKRKLRNAFWNYFQEYLPEKWEVKK